MPVLTSFITDRVKKLALNKTITKEHKKWINVKNKVFSNDPEEANKQKLAFQAEQLRAGEEFEKRFIRRMNDLFVQQKKSVLKSMSSRSIDTDKFLLSEDENIKLTIEKITPSITSTIIEQSKRAFALLGVSNALSSRNDAVKNYLEKNVVQLATSITKETNKLLSRTLAKGVDAGDSIAQMSRAVNSLFNNMKRYRSDRIARTEVIRATSFATEEAYIQSGVVEAKEWLTFRDERTDDECMSLNGKIIGLNKNYFDKGDKFGQFKIDYSDVAGPPLHINCRCTLTPVVIA